MASSRDYLEFILEQLSLAGGISYRYMMGDYIIYRNGKIVGGIFDDRFLVKPVKSAVDFVDEPEFEIPYPKGKPMLSVTNVDDKQFLAELMDAMYDELPFPKPKKPRGK